MRRLPSLVLAASAIVCSGCNCGKANVLTDTTGILNLKTKSLEFGPVTEFTQKTMTITVANDGKGELNITAKLDATSSADFVLGTVPATVDPGTSIDLSVTFSPLGSGDDVGAVTLTSDDMDQPTATISIHGGPIFASLGFEPDGGSLAFAPTSMSLTQKYATVRSVGGATLHLSAVGVNASGNPDFSVVPPMLPAALKPGEGVAVEVDYSRSMRATVGVMEAISDDPDAGLRSLQLIPDPAHQCEDGIDNDGDGLIDFPADPGCTDPTDDDEYNPPECVDGAMRSCGTSIGICSPGEQICAHSIWGGCDGGVAPMAEKCNGLDDNCNGVTDEGITEICTIFGCAGARACIPDSGVPDGSYTDCIPVAAMPEICNGKDDNCNGMIDEGIVQSCVLNGCPGIQICIPGGDGGFTACMPNASHAEICNGLDDDCNGKIDDGIAPITCGKGPCVRSVPGCVDGGIPTCVPGTGTTETCNDIDDDCDGTIDDGVPPMACYDGTAGTEGVGRCRGGTQNCSMGSFSGACNGEVLPTTEICGNNIDDNCNNQVDEGCNVDGGCDPRGLWTLDGGPLTYFCCSGAVNFDINSFFFADAGVNFRAIGKPTEPYNNVQTTTYPTCPSGGFTATHFASGGGYGCDETYTLTVTFTSANTWQGVFSASYTSAGCTDPDPFPLGCGSEPCISQTWPVQGYR